MDVKQKEDKAKMRDRTTLEEKDENRCLDC